MRKAIPLCPTGNVPSNSRVVDVEMNKCFHLLDAATYPRYYLAK